MFKDRFHTLRTANKYTQSEIAEQMNVSVQTVYHWEKGLFLPTIDTLLQLADFFCVSVDDLLDHSDRRFLEVTGLTDEQLDHLQQIINDIRHP